MIAGAILAAGSSSRFGPRPKQLAELDGRPLLEHAIGAMVAVTALERIVVVLGAAAEEIVTRLDFQRSEPLLAEDWEAGQAASLRCAVDELSTHAEAVVVTLGDQPRIAPRAIARVVTAAARTEAARATYAGLPGHPVLLKKSLFGRIANLRGDVGARELLQAVAVSDTECSDLGPMIDVDTREELEELQRSLSRYASTWCSR